jgi:hypothetical protein
MRARLGIAPQIRSCHTALVDGYAMEGHVPAREMLRLLKERPAALGLAVPGMPVGSPGMDGDGLRRPQGPVRRAAAGARRRRAGLPGLPLIHTGRRRARSST